MTGSYCSSCGAGRSPGASFCASCGAAVATPPATQDGTHPASVAAPAQGATQSPYPSTPEGAPPAPDQPQYPAQQPYAAQPYPAQPPYGTQPQPAQQPYPVQPPYPAQQPPYGTQPQPAQQPYPAQPPYAGPPAAAPWGAAGAPGAPQAAGSGRSPIDALLTGDWGGAAKAAVLAVAAMLAVSLVGMLLFTSGGVGFRETLALVLGGACLAVGGDFYAEADAESFGASSSFGLLPLTVTLVGLGVLGWLFGRQLRAQQPTSTTEVLLHGVRTALVFTVCFLPLALLTRYKADGTDALATVGRLGVGVISTLFGALLFAVAVLGLIALHRSTTLPGRLGAFRDKALAPLVGAVAVFSAGLLAFLAVLIYGLIEDGEKMMQLGVAVLGAANGALATVLWSAGVPLDFEGSANATGPLAQFAPVGSDSVNLFTFTDDSAWYWLAPLVLLATMVLVATALAVRQNTIEDARREGFRFAGALALVAFVAALLLRIGFGAEGDATEFSAGADGSAMFNPLLAAFALAIWGVLTGLLAPVLAAQMPSGFVTGVRRRFGAAVEPTPPVH